MGQIKSEDTHPRAAACERAVIKRLIAAAGASDEPREVTCSRCGSVNEMRMVRITHSGTLCPACWDLCRLPKEARDE
jgi:hypothetical protein